MYSIFRLFDGWRIFALISDEDIKVVTAKMVIVPDKCCGNTPNAQDSTDSIMIVFRSGRGPAMLEVYNPRPISSLAPKYKYN